jgi:hypothetical protein
MNTSASFPRKSPFQYLRWETGNYGRERLEQLAKLDHHPNAERIRELASTALQAKNPWEPAWRVDANSVLSALKVYPTGRTLDASLAAAIKKDIEKAPYVFANITGTEHPASGLYVDLNGDGIDEFVIFGCCAGIAYQHRTDGWSQIGNVRAVHPATTPIPWSIDTDLKNQHVEVTSPEWKDLHIGNNAFRVDVSR